jgi:hypothetical protein
MCIICAHLDVNKLTPWEAAANRKEMLNDIDKDHLEELDKKITKALHKYLDNLKHDEGNI